MIIVWAVGLQASLWSLKKTPEFKEKFPEVAQDSQTTTIRWSSTKD